MKSSFYETKIFVNFMSDIDPDSSPLSDCAAQESTLTISQSHDLYMSVTPGQGSTRWKIPGAVFDNPDLETMNDNPYSCTKHIEYSWADESEHTQLGLGMGNNFSIDSENGLLNVPAVPLLTTQRDVNVKIQLTLYARDSTPITGIINMVLQIWSDHTCTPERTDSNTALNYSRSEAFAPVQISFGNTSERT